MTPDWIPNIHPFIVHFPVALLITAVVFDLARLLFRNQGWLRNTVLALYSTGTIGLAASFLTGRQAADTVSVTGDAIRVITSHEDWALYTLIYFSAYTLLRFWTWWKEYEVKLPVFIGLIILAVTGTGLLWQTGEQGAKLVYKYGVAVGETERLQEQIETLQSDLASFREGAEPVVEENGSWSWRAGPGAGQVLTEYFTIEGSQNISAETGRDEGQNHLELSAGRETTFVLIKKNLANLEGRIELNASEFEGDFMLIHHYQSPETYQYLRLTDSRLEQGQVRDGSDNVLGSGQIDASEKNWQSIRVTASSGHYYGYSDQQTVLHTHDDALPAGGTGIALSGEGNLKIRFVKFESL